MQQAEPKLSRTILASLGLHHVNGAGRVLLPTCRAPRRDLINLGLALGYPGHFTGNDGARNGGGYWPPVCTIVAVQLEGCLRCLPGFSAVLAESRSDQSQLPYDHVCANRPNRPRPARPRSPSCAPRADRSGGRGNHPNRPHSQHARRVGPTLLPRDGAPPCLDATA